MIQAGGGPLYPCHPAKQDHFRVSNFWNQHEGTKLFIGTQPAHGTLIPKQPESRGLRTLGKGRVCGYKSSWVLLSPPLITGLLLQASSRVLSKMREKGLDLGGARKS